MPQPVKLSDALLLEARTTGAIMQRSMAGQIEFWATLGRAVERVSNRTQLEHLQQRAALPLSTIVSTISTPEGRQRLQSHLDSRPSPRFTPHPTLASTFIRETADGKRTTGRFHQGKFQPRKPAK